MPERQSQFGNRLALSAFSVHDPLVAAQRKESETSPADVWNTAKQRLNSMSAAQKADTLKAAGILTSAGNVSKPYKDVILPKKGK